MSVELSFEGLSTREAQEWLLKNTVRSCAIRSAQSNSSIKGRFPDYLRRDFYAQPLLDAVGEMEQEIAHARERGFDDIAERFEKYTNWFRRKYNCLIAGLDCCVPEDHEEG